MVLNSTFQLLNQIHLGNAGNGRAYLRIYARVSSTGYDIENNRTKYYVKSVLYYENSSYFYTGNTTTKSLSSTGLTAQSGGAAGNYYQGETVLCETSGYVTHNNDGTKSITVSANFTSTPWGWNGTVSANAVLPTIPRHANITAAPNFNDEENPTINYSNPAGNAITSIKACISLTGEVDDIKYRDIPKTGSSYTFELTDEERKILRNATLTSNTREVTFFVSSVIGGVTNYSTLKKTLTIVNAIPELTVSAKDTGGYSTPLTGNTNKIIKGFNYVNVSMSSVLKKGATIKNQTITNGSQKIEGASGGFNNTENNTFIFSLTDSRGNTVTKNITLEMVDYIKLTCNLETKNPTADGKMTFKISGNYFKGNFGAVDNTLAVEFRYKENDGEYSEWLAAEPIPTISGNTYENIVNLTGLNYRSNYTFQARAIDKTITILSSEKKVRTIPVYDWGENDFNINGELKINDVPMTDFIVEQGVSGIWNYRKWASGLAECWAISQNDNINASKNNLNGFYYSDAISKDLPFTFKTVNYYAVTGGSLGNMNIIRPAGYSTSKISYWVISAANNLTNISIVANLEVKGTWK
jgi:hypothetical protein